MKNSKLEKRLETTSSKRPITPTTHHPNMPADVPFSVAPYTQPSLCDHGIISISSRAQQRERSYCNHRERKGTSKPKGTRVVDVPYPCQGPCQNPCTHLLTLVGGLGDWRGQDDPSKKGDQTSDNQ
ncbi:Protein of unknown function [Pyronema omphalodes CBS 100304]|uniref:Uncharacterized protein n=1 Tax=Pyronema omphalodes (strain CBS 100304) TaxID=1076935 RepID=U4LSR1_PYROM|nr:Protein of unknown function [Pyronema omphalodes CBS 100304]